MKRHTIPSEVKDIVARLMQTYCIEGKVKWKEAFAAHPDWQKTLLEKFGDMQRIYQYANSVKTRAKAKTSAQESAPVKAPAPQSVEQVHFCPRCGLNIKICNAAFAVAIKHSN